MARFRRLRKNAKVRAMARETVLAPEDVIQPFFVIEGNNKKEAIESMPGVYRYSIDMLIGAIEEYRRLGGNVGLFFGLPERKDASGSEAHNLNGIIQKAVKAIKTVYPDFIVITDVCLCAYTDHGHCGLLDGEEIDNDSTVEVLARIAVTHAQAGADIVAPSDMMDLRVGAIRKALNKEGFTQVAIMSYSAKYCSSFYGPFRDAADCAPQFGDRKTYQMDPANQKEALKEAQQDVIEGADFIMVKPALAYLDVVSLLKKELSVPVVAYNVSGEYAMIKAAAQNNWINEKEVVLEALLSMKRAGADVIITYYAQKVLQWLGGAKKANNETFRNLFSKSPTVPGGRG